MAVVPDNRPAVDRRSFILARAIHRGDAAVGAPADIASVLVQTRPEHVGTVAAAIAKLAGCEIHGRDPKGKLVVVIDAPDTGAVGAALNTIAGMEHVLSAVLVFHAIDSG
jgi:nitrate reductase NapD